VGTQQSLLARLSADLQRVTEAAAVAASRLAGKENPLAADAAAVEAMRAALASLSCRVTVAAGEGERDDAPFLFRGETLGNPDSPDLLEIAVDPLECTKVCARGGPGSLSVMLVGLPGSLLPVPDIFMHKLAVGPVGKGLVDIDASIGETIHLLAERTGRPRSEIRVLVLDRPYNQELIASVRNSGAQALPIGDGDVDGAIATCLPERRVDLLLGIGGASEALLAAGALASLGGEIQARFHFRDERDRESWKSLGFRDPARVYRTRDFVSGPALFFATGVTTGELLRGPELSGNSWLTHSLVLKSFSA
jgi:fructose-1,6-bisphosphatase class II